MNRKGFLLIHVLLGLFLFGLISVICFPILNTSINNIKLSKAKIEMISIAESTIEQIKSFDYHNTNDTELIFDLQLIKLIQILKEEHNISLPLDIEKSEYKYLCNINKKEKDNLWEIKVSVGSKDKEKRINDVEITAFMPIPKKDFGNEK